MGGVKEELTLGLLARRGYRVPPMLTKSCEGTKKNICSRLRRRDGKPQNDTVT